MKCNHCGSEWNVSPGLSVSVTSCPFCGKSLLPEKKKLETIEDVLVAIHNQFGVSVLTDETKLIAYFSDMAPQLSRQRRILGYFVECGGPRRIVSVLNSSDDEQSVCVKQIIREMKDEMYIEEAASQMICESFFFAVSGRRLLAHSTSDASNVDPPLKKQAVSLGNPDEILAVNSQKTPVKPVASSWSMRMEMTAEEQYQKGEVYYNGTVPGDVFSRDYSKAFEWYQKAAIREYVPAQKKLGFMYSLGEGVPKDRKLALDWYIKAAKQGDLEAQYKVGLEFLRETGDTRAVEQAIYWLTLAAEREHAPAQESLGYVYMNSKHDYVKAAYWLEKAESQGRMSASSVLKRCNEKRFGTGQDNLKTGPKAAVQGDEEAKPLLSDLSRKEITEEQVRELVKKYNLGYKYFAKGSREFEKKILKAITAYAAESAKESPILLEDHTILGSAKEGFVLTANNVYYCLGIGGKGRFPLGRVLSVSVSDFGKLYRVTLETIQGGHSVPVRLSYASDKQDAEKMALFWRDLLQLNQ